MGGERVEPAGASFADRRVREWIEDWSRLGPREAARRAARAVYRGDPRPWEQPHATSALRAELQRLGPTVPRPPVRERRATPDGAEKLLLDLGPGLAVETVLIPEARSRRSRAHMQGALAPATTRDLSRRPPRASGCVSTQVGCGVGCVFCASGREGLVRNLGPGQMVAQALHLRAAASARGYHLGSLVFMGMGEPFHNTDALLVALENLTSPDGAQIGASNVSVSTVGVPQGIERLAREGPRVNLALSLHAPDDATRAAIVPLARRLPPVQALCALADDYARRTRRQASISYVLLDGVNDAPAQARDLAALLAPFERLRHVNLIPWNAVEGLPLRASPPERTGAFFAALRAAGLNVHLRRTRGAEAEAACGQLALRSGRRALPTAGDREYQQGTGNWK